MGKKNFKIIYDFENDDIKNKVLNILPDLDDIFNKIGSTIYSFFKNNIFFSIYFVEIKTIAQLNYKFRQIDAPTDVLSFENIGNEAKNEYIGEIIISIDKIIERAKDEDDTIENTFVYMVFHSFLHLNGYNHDNEDDYKIFEEKTEELMRRYNDI